MPESQDQASDFESVLEQYPVKLANFEGPLDLLLHLIRKHEVDIYDIPIVLITQQYLEYLDVMKELDLDLAGEFLLMAATLIHIKARTLVLQCKEDIIAPECVGEYVHAQVQGSEYMLLEATGHCPNLSAPEEVTAAIRAFV